MASSALKPVVNKIIAPIASALLSLGVTPNVVTFIGTIGSSLSAAYFFSQGSYVIGAILVSLFTLSDMFDGAMARLSEKGPSDWGAFLDSTFDRITDAAILGGLIIHFIRTDNPLTNLAVVALVLGMLVPYIRAKAESFGIDCTVGIAERTERLMLILVGIGFDGLGVPYILATSIYILAITSAITIFQRVAVIRRGLGIK